MQKLEAFKNRVCLHMSTFLKNGKHFVGYDYT